MTVLYALTELSNTEIAGPSSVTFAAGAAVGSVAYAHFGEVDWTMAVVVGFITLFTTANCLVLDAVDVPVVLLTGSAYVVGIGAGWRVAHRIDPRRLKVALGIVLLALAPVIVFS